MKPTLALAAVLPFLLVAFDPGLGDCVKDAETQEVSCTGASSATTVTGPATTSTTTTSTTSTTVPVVPSPQISATSIVFEGEERDHTIGGTDPYYPQEWDPLRVEPEPLVVTG